MEQVWKKIKLKKQQPNIAHAIEQGRGVNAVTARVLAARGFKEDEILKNFLEPTLARGLPSPEDLKNLSDAAKLIVSVAKSGAPIALACDFDVDGLSSGSQLFEVLKKLGVGVKAFVPDRFEDGYGLNESMVRSVAEEGYKLLVCLDFGTSNTKELTVAKELGLKTVVIDHHHVETAPACDVFVNPQQSGCGFADGILCSAGLTWYLGCAIRKEAELKEFDPKSHLELSCLGTICDMVPLIGPNRVIAKRGLEALSKTSRPGLIALKEVAGVKQQATCTDVSFGIGPRLNAAGRIEHGSAVIELLTTTDMSRARMIARRLDSLNRERQETENDVKAKALQKISLQKELGASLVVWDPEFHTGVVGIVAQRLVEQFYRPSVVLGLDAPGIFKGSVRGIKGMSVVEALSKTKKFLIKFGGHEGAGGLSLKEEHLKDFAEAFEATCRELSTEEERLPYVEADTEIELSEISVAVIDELQKLAPFGMKNPSPQLLLKEVTVGPIAILKNAHLKTSFSIGTKSITGLMWRQTAHPKLKPGAKVNVLVKLDYNNYNGLTELQGHIQAVE